MYARFGRAATILSEAVAAKAFPAACIEVGRRQTVLWRASFGHLSYHPDAPDTGPDTIFDLASLTKVIATTTLVMRAVDDGSVSLDDPVGKWIRTWSAADRRLVTIADLLAHCSGLTAHLPYFRDHTGRAEFEAAIATSPLEYAPRSRSVYSDLGFILLGFILEDARNRGRAPWPGATDAAAALDVQFRAIASYVTPEPLTYNPPRAWRERIAPTEHDPWRGRTLVGEVHDENAWALRGVAGHAGVFGTAAAVGAFARAVLHTLGGGTALAASATAHLFARRRSDIAGSSRALGWDTMLPTSSCGTLMSPTAVGHTGFTGTSLWIDWERDLYVALLTNRVHPTRQNEAIRAVRPKVHDAIMAELSPG